MVRYTITIIIAIAFILAGCQEGVLPKGCPAALEVSESQEQAQEQILPTVSEETEGSSDPLTVATLAGFDVSDGLPTKVVKAGEGVSFPNLKAQDPEGDPVTFSFSFPLDQQGNWQTQTGDEGEYIVLISASDGVNDVSQRVRIIVLAGNAAPEISVSKIIDVREGELVEINADVTDADGDDVDITFSGWIESGTYQTTFDDAGDHTVVVTASDGKETVSEEISVIVKDVNRAPKLTTIPDVLVTAGQTVALRPKASDPDGDDLEFSFSAPLDDQGLWETTDTDVGSHRVTVMVSDGLLNDEIQFFVVVDRPNTAPEILSFEDVTVDEGDVVVFTPDVSDPDGDELTVSYSGWMTSDTKVTSFGDSGVHEVMLTVSDGIDAVTATATVTVLDVNRPPVFGDGAFD